MITIKSTSGKVFGKYMAKNMEQISNILIYISRKHNLKIVDLYWV